MNRAFIAGGATLTDLWPEHYVQWASDCNDYRHHFINPLQMEDDAETCDVVMQFVIFGECMYS